MNMLDESQVDPYPAFPYPNVFADSPVPTQEELILPIDTAFFFSLFLVFVNVSLADLLNLQEEAIADAKALRLLQVAGDTTAADLRIAAAAIPQLPEGWVTLEQVEKTCGAITACLHQLDHLANNGGENLCEEPFADTFPDTQLAPESDGTENHGAEILENDGSGHDPVAEIPGDNGAENHGAEIPENNDSSPMPCDGKDEQAVKISEDELQKDVDAIMGKPITADNMEQKSITITGILDGHLPWPKHIEIEIAQAKQKDIPGVDSVHEAAKSLRAMEEAWKSAKLGVNEPPTDAPAAAHEADPVPAHGAHAAKTSKRHGKGKKGRKSLGKVGKKNKSKRKLNKLKKYNAAKKAKKAAPPTPPEPTEPKDEKPSEKPEKIRGKRAPKQAEQPEMTDEEKEQTRLLLKKMHSASRLHAVCKSAFHYIH